MQRFVDDSTAAASAERDCGTGSVAAAGEELFNASRYEFFGKQMVEDVELGGFEDGLNHLSFHSFDEKERGFSSSELVDSFRSLIDIDDLSTTFEKLNRTISGPRHPGVIGDRASSSRESSSATDCTLETDSPKWLGEQRWWSQPHPQAQYAEPKPLHRTSTYPQEPQHHPHDSFPVHRTHYNSLDIQPNDAKNLTRHASIPSLTSSLPSHSPVFSPLSYSPHLLSTSLNDHSYKKSIPLTLSNLPFGGQHGSNLLNQSSLFSPERASLLCNFLQQQQSHSNNMMASPLSQQRFLPAQQIQHSFLPHVQSHLLNQYPSQVIGKIDGPFSVSEPRYQWSRTSQKGRQKDQIPPFSNLSRQNSDSQLPLFKSKYMTCEELQGVLKMKHREPRSKDPYNYDYYHQACLAKRSADPHQRLYFCPSSMNDLFSRASSSDAHAYHWFNAQKLRLLFEDDQPVAVQGGHENTISRKPLEQDPKIAVSVVIEDGFSFLLDIIDIDRISQSNLSQDGAFQLQQKKQVLLEEFAASLQLLDPFDAEKTAVPEKHDVVFVKIVSLPKGRKLLCRYLHLISPTSQLALVVCLAIFRNLRILFAGLPPDTSTVEVMCCLLKIVTSCVRCMDLRALGACLFAVVCSTELPPFGPHSSTAGDGASKVVQSVLDQATIVTRNLGSNNWTLWNASFSAFFDVLTDYCFTKCESIAQNLLRCSNLSHVESGFARAISEEMPVELIQACLPHVNEHQRDKWFKLMQTSTSGFT